MKMVREVGTYEAKTHFSQLLDEVASGTRIVVTRHGKAVAELVPAEEPKKRAKRGCAKGPGFYMAENFDAPLEEFREYM